MLAPALLARTFSSRLLVLFAVLLPAATGTAQARNVIFVGGQSNAKVQLAMGVRDVLVASGEYSDSTLDVVQSSYPGSSINSWFYDGIPRSSYDGDFYDIDASGSGKVEAAMNADGGGHTFLAFFWWQGEGDSGSAASYATRFKGMLDYLGQDLGQVAGSASGNWSYHIALPYIKQADGTETYTAIRNAQIAMVNADAAFATYHDTKPYPRPDGNPHVTVDGVYYVGVEMGNQFLAMKGLPTVDLTPDAEVTIVKIQTASMGPFPEPNLARAAGWTPMAIPGPNTILKFGNTLPASQYYDSGTTELNQPLLVKGIVYESNNEVMLAVGSLRIGSAGIDGLNAGSNFRCRYSLQTTEPQTWRWKAGKKMWFSEAGTVSDLTQATLTGSGLFEFQAGTYKFGSSSNTAPMSFYGKPTLHFSAAADGGYPSPLGTNRTLSTGQSGDTTFVFNGGGAAQWNRDLLIGSNGTFNILNAKVPFTSTGTFGLLNGLGAHTWRLGGAGDLEIAGTGGIKTKDTATCHVEKFGAGTVTLSGTGNTFNGTLTMSQGTLHVTGAASVNSAASITLNGGTLIYDSAVPLAHDMVVAAGSDLILDSELSGSTLSVASGGRLILRGNATLPEGLTLTNRGTIDITTWTGNLPAGFVNEGAVIDQSALRIQEIQRDGPAPIAIQGYRGHRYQLQVTQSLSDLWQNVGAAVDGADETVLLSPDSGSYASLFYRVVVQP